MMAVFQRLVGVFTLREVREVDERRALAVREILMRLRTGASQSIKETNEEIEGAQHK